MRGNLSTLTLVAILVVALLCLSCSTNRVGTTQQADSSESITDEELSKVLWFVTWAGNVEPDAWEELREMIDTSDASEELLNQCKSDPETCETHVQDYDISRSQ